MRRVFEVLNSPWVWAFAIQVAFVFVLRIPFDFQLDGRSVFGVADDVYISACYGRSLADGFGLAWFAGAEPVEGFTSPLHVLYFAVVHTLPFFREEHLGIYATALSLACLAGAFALGSSISAALSRRRALDGLACPDPSVSLRVATALVAAAPVAITWWLAEGFEIGLVLVAALASVRVAMGELDPARRGLALGAIASAAVWARMDGALYVLPGFFVLAVERARLGRGGLRRALCAAGGVSVVAVIALFSARFAIFGEWMPNTYYLKLTGSALSDRVALGLKLALPAVPVAVAALILGLWMLRRRSLDSASVVVASLVLIMPLGLAYSIHNGGDTWPFNLGADRFASIGLSTFGIGLAAWIHACGGTVSRTRVLAAGSLVALTAISPALPNTLESRRTYLTRFYTGFYVRKEQTWFRLGRALEQATRPGALITTGAAGAVIYASHRGGIDVHGKCDREIAHLPVLDPNRTAGHQKNYVEHVFNTRDPEISVSTVPDSAIDRYCACQLDGQRVWIARTSTHVIWSEFDAPCGP